MQPQWNNLPQTDINIDYSKVLGGLDLKSHSTGIGGVNSLPAPTHAVEGIKALQPKLIRIFIQEFFEVYEGDGVYHWEKMDAFMESVAAMGADIMASICIKPLALFPKVDETVWRPNNEAEWQEVVRRMVRRYSLEHKYVTHWAIANEINIGEDGGCPYMIKSAGDYYEYYVMTVKPVLEVMPGALVGGPSWAGAPSEKDITFFDEFIALCKKNNTRLDFLSYNVYSDNPEHHVAGALRLEEVVRKHGLPIDYYVTEFNVSIGSEVSVEEIAYCSRRAASLAVSILSMRKQTKVTGTFQYHAYDVYNDPREFAPFYAKTRYMAKHWNDIPHRLGLFSYEGSVRPQYFVYQMLYSLAGQEISAETGAEGIYTIAAKDGNILRVLLVNFKLSGTEDAVAHLHFANIPEGVYRVTVTKIDDKHRWDETFSMIPTENRITYAHSDFLPSVYLPGDSVALVTMELLP